MYPPPITAASAIPRASLGHDEAVAGEKAIIGEAEPAEAVVAMRIDAGIIEDEVRRECVEQRRQTGTQNSEVAGVVEPVRQADI